MNPFTLEELAALTVKELHQICLFYAIEIPKTKRECVQRILVAQEEALIMITPPAPHNPDEEFDRPRYSVRVKRIMEQKKLTNL